MRVFVNKDSGECICTDLAVGFDQSEWTEVLDVPADYDTSKANYIFVDGAFVSNVSFALQQLRAERDVRLAATDWTQLTDQTDGIKAAWKPYRQALRDLPDATADPFAPQWPTPPADQ